MSPMSVPRNTLSLTLRGYGSPVEVGTGRGRWTYGSRRNPLLFYLTR